MGGFGSALITGAANARSAFSEGKQKAQETAQQAALKNALLMRQMKRQEEQDRLAAALQGAQMGEIGARTAKLREPVKPKIVGRETDQEGNLYSIYDDGTYEPVRARDAVNAPQTAAAPDVPSGIPASIADIDLDLGQGPTQQTPAKRAAPNFGPKDKITAAPQQRTTSKGIEQWDPKTSQWVVTGDQPYREPKTKQAPSLRTTDKGIEQWNSETGQWELSAQPPSTTRDTRPSQGERDSAALMPEIIDAQGKIDALTPSIISSFVKRGILGNYVKTTEGRRFDQLADQFITNVVYAKTGKAATDAEKVQLRSYLIPQPGDELDPQILAQKKIAREKFLEGAYISAGRAAKEVRSLSEDEWAAQNKPKPGETLEQYEARYQAYLKTAVRR